MDVWVEQELDAGEFPDQRLKTRLGKILGDLGRKIGDSLPTACQDWAATKAAYRFFSNRRVDENIILAGHFAATRSRFAKSSGPMLVLHDTTEFSFKRNCPEAIGRLSLLKGQHAYHTVCGLLMHSSLVLTAEGLPLGLAAIKFWTRKKFKGTNALKKKVNPTRIPIESKESVRWLENMAQSTQQLGDPVRCVHIGDRESDIFELFCKAHELKTHFLVRTCVDRLAGRGGTTISKKMEREPIQGEHEVEVRDNQGRVSTTTVYLRFCQMTVHPPIGKQRRYPALSLTVIHAHERGTPVGREPIQWKLLTNCPVNDLPAAVEKLNWYAQRWKVETFHKVLKSGCQAEQSKLRSAERLTNLLAVLCIIGWRVFWLTMMNRATPEAPAEIALTKTEIEILDRIAASTKPPTKPTVAHYLVAIAKLGGYLARANDSPPGNMVLWRGLTRLTDIHLGFELKNRFVGN
jgi:Transposase DNA-binding/Transposase Tn5 dimerisation domain